MNQSLKIVLAYAMCLAISLEGMPRILAEKPSAQFLTEIKTLMEKYEGELKEISPRKEKIAEERVEKIETEKKVHNEEGEDEEEEPKSGESGSKIEKSEQQFSQLVENDEKDVIKKNIYLVLSKLNEKNKGSVKLDLQTNLGFIAFLLKFSDEYVWEGFKELLAKTRPNSLDKERKIHQYYLSELEEEEKSFSNAFNILIIKTAIIYYENLKDDRETFTDNKDLCEGKLNNGQNPADLKDEIVKLLINRFAKSKSDIEGKLNDYINKLTEVFNENIGFYCKNRDVFRLKVYRFMLPQKDMTESIFEHKHNELKAIVKKCLPFLDANGKLVKSEFGNCDDKYFETPLKDLKDFISLMTIVNTSKSQKKELLKNLMTLLNNSFQTLNDHLSAFLKEESGFSSEVLSFYKSVIDKIFEDFIPGQDQSKFYEEYLKDKKQFGSDSIRTIHSFALGALIDSDYRKKFFELSENVPKNFEKLLEHDMGTTFKELEKFEKEISNNDYDNPECLSLIYLFALSNRETTLFDDFGQKMNFQSKYSLIKHFKCFYGKNSKFYTKLSPMMRIFEHDGELKPQLLVPYKLVHEEIVTFIYNKCVLENQECQLSDFNTHLTTKTQTKEVKTLRLKSFLKNADQGGLINESVKSFISLNKDELHTITFLPDAESIKFHLSQSLKAFITGFKKSLEACDSHLIDPSKNTCASNDKSKLGSKDINKEFKELEKVNFKSLTEITGSLREFIGGSMRCVKSFEECINREVIMARNSVLI
jgi:hypothetical protein